jgi:hypothetical protein
MPVSVTFNGTLYNIPASGETGWATVGTNFLVDVGNNALCLTGTQTMSNKVLTLQNGSAATPSLSFTADTASGLYQPLASELAIATGGTERVLIDSSGVVNVLGAPGIVNASAGDLSLQSTSGAVRAPTMVTTDKSTAVATTAFVATSPAVTDNIGRNYLHNPMFRVQQRGLGAFTANAAYTADRWQIELVTDTVSYQIGTYSDAQRVTIGDEEAVYYLTNTFTGSSSAGAYNYIKHSIEGVRRLSNKTVTVSFWANATSGTPKLGINAVQVFGTGGSPSSSAWALATGNSVTISTTITRYTTTFTIPSTSGKTLGTTANTDYTGLAIAYSSGATNNAIFGNIGVQTSVISIWGVQLEVASNATALEKTDIRFDTANCQRFYNQGAIISAGYATTSGQIYVPLAYPVTMRTTPTVAGANNSSTNITSPTAVASAAAPTQVVVGSGTVTSTGMYIVNATYTATADF